MRKYLGTIEHVLFILLASAVLVWRISLGINDTESKKEQISCDKNTEEVQLYDNWDDFIQAVIIKESRGDSLAVGKNNDVGVLQITPVIVRDVNRILGENKYTLSDRTSVLKSVEMFNIIQNHYNPNLDLHLALKIWNPKAPISYHRDIMYIYDTIQENKKFQDDVYTEIFPVDPID